MELDGVVQQLYYFRELQEKGQVLLRQRETEKLKSEREKKIQLEEQRSMKEMSKQPKPQEYLKS